jgi:DNA topoisomerase III
MTKRLFIAEKPAMGQSIAMALPGVVQKSRYAWTVGDDTVAWCIGHLLELAPAQDYDPKFEKWDLSHLPIVPSPWKMQVVSDKKELVSGIKQLLKSCDEVIHAGDPGREGQVIVDELLEFLGNKKPVRRISLQSLDVKSVREGLTKLKPNTEFAPLYFAGKARGHADWSMGINMTRAYTLLGRQVGFSGVLSIGRVQTPTLAIVVQRDRAIESFVSKDFWTPFASFSVSQGTFSAKWTPPKGFSPAWMDESKRIVSLPEAQKIVQRAQGKNGRIQTFTEEPKLTAPPLPFNLATIQMFANRAWGFTASDTLKICQALYDAKLTSYPRGDCSYLPTNLLPEVPEVLAAIAGNHPALASTIQNADASLQSGVWDDKKIGEHYAIIPTRLVAPSVLAAFPDTHRQIYDALSKRYVAQFYPSAESMITTVDVLIPFESTPVEFSALTEPTLGDVFHASGARLVSPGWRVVYGSQVSEQESDEDDVGTATFPVMSANESALCQKAELKASKTTAPLRLTEASLLDAMIHVHQLVSDPELKKKLQSTKGIGTPATRHTIIETLVQRGFIVREKKNFVSTPIGRTLVDLCPPKMVDPGWTALWENAFDGIAKSEDPDQARLRYRTFMDKQNDWVKQLLTLAPQSDFTKLPIEPKTQVASLPGQGQTCPQCNKGQMLTRLIKQGKSKGKSFLGCSNYPACNHSIWP